MYLSCSGSWRSGLSSQMGVMYDCNVNTLWGKCRRVCWCGIITEAILRGIDYIGIFPCKLGKEKGSKDINVGRPKLVEP